MVFFCARESSRRTKPRPVKVSDFHHFFFSLFLSREKVDTASQDHFKWSSLKLNQVECHVRGKDVVVNIDNKVFSRGLDRDSAIIDYSFIPVLLFHN